MTKERLYRMTVIHETSISNCLDIVLELSNFFVELDVVYLTESGRPISLSLAPH